MPKGMFTQGLCVLLQEPVTVDEIESALGDFEILKRPEHNFDWQFSGPSLTLAFDLPRNGLVSVDCVDRLWPDHMGDAENESTTFAAWSMGHFGPFAWPGGLERASTQCWAWEEGKTVAAQHASFLRVRCSYAFGADDDRPIMPQDYDPLRELLFVTQIVDALLNLPQALCYFNPNGELLQNQKQLRDTLDFGSTHELPPLDAWSNVRLFHFDEDWILMDTAGNLQLDIADVEACFHRASYDLGQIDNFLRNASLYLLNNGDIINDRDTMDGPGDIAWQAHHFDNGICDPPRTVLRWLPMDGRPVPDAIRADDSSA